MAKEYVEQRDGGYYVANTRVSLDSVVYAYLRGDSPEGIAESFPALSLEQIFGSLAFYAANRREVDENLQAEWAEFDAARREWRDRNPAMYRRLTDARQQTPVPGA